MNRLQGYVRNSRTWWAAALVVIVAMAVRHAVTQESHEAFTGEELVVATESPVIQVVAEAQRVWEDTAGLQHSLFSSSDGRYRVLTFVTTDCPIANACQPELSRLCELYSEANVDFYQINSTQSATLDAAKEHVESYGISMPMILDSDQSIARRVNAKVTPEAFVISPVGDVLYRGRINDLYAGYGKRRREASSHDLRDAVAAALAGEPIAIPETKPVGCFIQYARKEHAVR